MQFISRLGLATAVAMATLAAGVATPVMAAKEKKAEEAKPKVSKGFAAVYNESAKLLNKEDAAGANASLPALRAAVANDDDKYILGKFLVGLGGKLKDTSMQLEGLQMSVATQIIPVGEKGMFNYFIGKLNFGKKNYAGALQALQASKDLGYNADDLLLIMSLTHFELNQNPAAFDALRAAIAARKAAGQTADQTWFGRGLKVASDTKNAKEIGYWARALVSNYPTSENWRAALSLYRDGVNLSAGENLDLMRLMRKANAMISERDYGEYVDAASPVRLPGEVISVIKEARTKGAGMGSSAYLTEQLQLAQSRESADRASLPSSERDSMSSKNGKIALGTADAFLGYGQFAKAANYYSVAIDKGGIETDSALTRRGIALLEQGDLNGAKAEFAKVSAGNRKAIADYWTLYIDLKQAPAPVAPAATPAP